MTVNTTPDEYSHLRGSLNDFLRSEECEWKVTPRYAADLCVIFERHEVTIWTPETLLQFSKDHPGYFCDLTDEEIAQGVDGFRTLWQKYSFWAKNWDPVHQRTRQRDLLPLRRYRRA
jgi:hypothetical protein